MSHELRTPLNAIIGFSQILKDELFGHVGNPRYREYGKDIYESGNHLLNVINDILDLSKIEAGKLELRREDIDLSRLLAACLRLVRERARDASVKLVDGTSPDEMLVLAADETRVKQIIINLLSNAIKFTPAGGVVTVAARHRSDSMIEITVADTGIGMKPEDIPIAMQPFRQIETPTNRKYEGTGIGLPLTKALVEAHNGEMALESAAGVGTTVTVTLPVGPGPESRFAALADQSVPSPAAEQDVLPAPAEPIRLRARRR
jgi:signal transduction histidine kinase